MYLPKMALKFASWLVFACTNWLIATQVMQWWKLQSRKNVFNPRKTSSNATWHEGEWQTTWQAIYFQVIQRPATTVSWKWYNILWNGLGTSHLAQVWSINAWTNLSKKRRYRNNALILFTHGKRCKFWKPNVWSILLSCVSLQYDKLSIGSF